MKKLLSLLLTMILAVCFAACGAQEPFDKGSLEATVFVVTDTHLLSEDLFSEGNQKYIKENLTADGRVQECDYALMEALVEYVNREKPDALVFTGDLSFNGEKSSHRSLISFLERIDKNVKVLVIPGNHDFNIEDCRAYYNDSPHGENTVSGQEFCEMYSAYGYTGGISYDDESHSYIYEINEKLWAVMLDTTLCEYNEAAGLNTVAGAVWDETIEWLRPFLQEAKEKGITVVGFSHHNLAVHNERFTDDYVMYNAEALADLYREYGVKIHFSGHMHIQNVAKVGDTYDIAQGGLLDYGNRIGILDIYGNCMEYTRQQVGDIAEYSFGVFCSKYLGKRVSQYTEKYGEYGEEVHLLASEINAYYFDGDYQKINDILNEKTRAVKLLKKKEKDSYLGSILKVKNTDQNYLLIK